MFGSEWEACFANGMEFGQVRTWVTGAMSYYSIHLVADRVISTIDE